MSTFSHLFEKYPWAKLIAVKSMHILTLTLLILIFIRLTKIISRRIVNHRGVSDRPAQKTERDKRLATVVRLVETTLRVVLIGAAVMMALDEFGLDITPLLTGAGIAGLAVGFGAQSLVKDVITGFLLLVEDQIRVGDVIKVGAMTGTVERMELRITAIRDSEGTLHVIPNGEIKTVSNLTHGFAKAVVPMVLPYSVDLKKLSETLESVIIKFENDSEWKKHLKERPQFLGITEFLAGTMQVKVSVKTEPHCRWAVERELRRRIKLACDQNGITLS